MKNSNKIKWYLLLLIFTPILSFAQSISISHNNQVVGSTPIPVEVGIPVALTASCTVPNGYIITGIEWHGYSWIGLGGSGASGILGKVNGSTLSTYNSPYTVYTSNNPTTFSNSISFIWGDQHNITYNDQVYVKLLYIDSDGLSGEFLSGYVNLDIKRISAPALSTPASVVSCCPTTIHVSDGSFGDQDVWVWQVTNGTIQSGQNTNSIQVNLGLTGTIIIKATVSRNNGLSSYSYSTTKTITRTPPPPISLTGSGHLCQGDLLTLYLDEFCGEIEDIIWDYDKDLFDLVDYSNDEQPYITLDPLGGIGFGEPFVIGGIVKLVGGCVTQLIPHSVTIFNNEPPPCPSEEYLTLILPPNFDPCNQVGPISIEYNDPNFINGISTWNPQFLIIAGHHYVDRVEVHVCNTNPCAPEGEQTCCKDIVLFLPAPCNTGGGHPIAPPNNNTQGQPLFQNKISVYPNPASDILFFECSTPVDGTLSLLDRKGNKIFEKNLSQTTKGEINISHFDVQGVLYFVIQTEESITYEKIILNK